MAFNFTNPYGMVTGQPNIGPITPQPPQPPQTPNPMGGGKNDKLALMLYALGGALKGDKNFVQNTMQLQQMQEGKKKQEEQKKNYQEFLKTINPDSPFYDLAKSIGQEGLPKLLLERYKAETREIDPAKQIKQEEASVLKTLKDVGGDVKQLSKYQKLVYDNFIKRDDSESILQQLGIIGNTETGTGLIIEKISEG